MWSIDVREQYFHTYINYMDNRLVNHTILKFLLCFIKSGCLWYTFLVPHFPLSSCIAKTYYHMSTNLLEETCTNTKLTNLYVVHIFVLIIFIWIISNVALFVYKQINKFWHKKETNCDGWTNKLKLGTLFDNNLSLLEVKSLYISHPALLDV